MVQEDLKDLRIAMAKLQRIEFAGPWQNRTDDIHSDMGAHVWLPDLLSFLGEPPSRAGVPFYATLIQIPQIDASIVQKLPYQLDEGFSLFFVLTVRPWARDFEPEAFIVKPSHHRAIANLQLTLGREISVKLPPRPVGHLHFFRMRNQFPIFIGSLPTDLGRTPGPRSFHKPIYSPIVELPNPTRQRVLVHIKQCGHLCMGHPEYQGLDSHQACIPTLDWRSLSCRFQLRKGTVLLVRYVMLTTHTSLKAHSQQEVALFSRLVSRTAIAARNASSASLRSV